MLEIHAFKCLCGISAGGNEKTFHEKKESWVIVILFSFYSFFHIIQILPNKHVLLFLGFAF